MIGDAISTVKMDDFDSAILSIQKVSKFFPEYRKVTFDKKKTFLDTFIFSLVHKKSEILEKLIESQKVNTETASLEYVESLDYLHFLKLRLQDSFEKPLPLGPVLIYGSWSSPLLRFCEKVITALCLGNTVLFHAESSSSSIYNYFLQLAQAALFPEDSLAVVTTDSSSTLETIYSHPALRAVNFSGHSYEGEFFKKLPLDPRKKYKVSYGGRNPVIFLYDADLENLEELVISSLQYQYLGELRFNRWFVQEKIYLDVIERLKIIFSKLDPVVLKNFPNSKYNELFENQARSLKSEKGFASEFFGADFNNCSPWQQDELLGPVLTVTRFKNSVEALKFANTTYYANAAAVFSADPDKCKDLAAQLTMPLVTSNRLPERYWDKPLHSMYESGFGADITDLDFFNVPKSTSIY